MGGMKKKGYAMGGMKKKGYSKGGGNLKMVKGKDGKMVPFYAADGKGKMNKGGMSKKKKRLFKRWFLSTCSNVQLKRVSNGKIL